jgi:competence protein ComEA
MKNVKKRIAIAAVVLFGIAYIVIFNIFYYNEPIETVTAEKTVYSGSEFFIAGENFTDTEIGYEIPPDENAITAYELPPDVNAITAYEIPPDENAIIAYEILPDENAITAYIPDGEQQTPNAETVYLININTAGIDELMTLNGIGSVTAQAIIDHRTAHGGFTSVEQLLDVKGIGPAKFEAISEFVTVDGLQKESERTERTESTKINLNRATKDELMSFDGIGEVLAERIIAYRESFGFRTVEDLKNVEGIGDTLYAAIEPFAEV